ncbi:MAG: outer membrane protein assembly factor BamA, partial [Candidatus Dadabacteria bacterium]|nr:outer membrane protein assembly factor BamA [Candidatus Dadabacteria bacterium]NIQ14343.1 outer membrane protein assembly factor BamA [Candidatus Dadabacteria bacterium]
MIKKITILIIALFVVVSFHKIDSYAVQKNQTASYEGLDIQGISISGNKRIETELINLNIKTRIGDKYSKSQIREDVKNIYKLGYFDEVVVNVEKSGKQLFLEFNVRERPVVVDLRIIGNDEVNDESIEEIIQVKEGRIIDLKKVKDSNKSILDLYSQKGFVGTNVEYEIEPKGEGTVSVLYKINEGKTAYIKKIVLSGNQNIKSKKIKKRIYTKPKYYLSILTKRGLFNVEEVKRDSDRIRAIYLDEGYLDAKVSQPEIVYDEEREGYVVTFRIEEGYQYKVSDISFSGDLIAEDNELIDLLKLKEGEIFSSFSLQSDIGALTTFYGDKGYAFANVNPNVNLDRFSYLVSINFEMEKGKEVYVRNIDIDGNKRTRDSVIRREITLEEQKLFSSSKFQAARARINRLGYFEDNVEVTTERVPDSEDQLDVKIKVEEKPTGFFSIAGGFSSVETFLFAGQIQESNLFGYGKTLALNAQLGGVTRIVSLNYRDPYLLDTDWTFDTLLSYNDREFRDFDRESYGATFGFGRRLFRDFRATLSYRFENQDIEDVDRDARLIITESERTITSFGLTLNWDKRNSYIDPTDGYQLRNKIEYAGPFGGDTDFLRYTFTGKYYQSVWKSTY